MSVRMGDALEARTVRWLESVGWRAERVSRRGRFGTRDLFACIDLVAVNEAEVISPLQLDVIERCIWLESKGASYRWWMLEAEVLWHAR